MRITIAYDCLYPWTKGGGERVYRMLAEEFVALGHEVTYLTRVQWDPAQAPQIPGIRAVGIATTTLYDSQGVRRPTAAVHFAWNLWRSLRSHRRDADVVIVSATPVLNVFAARLALGRHRSHRLLVDWLEVWRKEQWIEYSGKRTGAIAFWLQRRALRWTPRAMTNSRFTAQRMKDQGFRGKTLIAGLIDSNLAVTPTLEVADQPSFLFVGRHIQDKQVETLPAALAELRREHPGARAVIVGKGPTTTLVHQEIDRLGLTDAIELVGEVPQDVLNRLFAQASALVLPSRREGYGLVVVEAAAHGTPSVVVQAIDNAAATLIREGLNGFVAESSGPRDLADAMQRILDGGTALRANTADWFTFVESTESVAATAQRIAEQFGTQAPAARGRS